MKKKKSNCDVESTRKDDMIRFVERTTIFIHGYLIQCFCDFAPLNSNSSARTVHTRTTVSNHNHHDSSDDDDDDHKSYNDDDDDGDDEHQHTETHTLSTLLKRNSLALSPATQPIHLARF